MTCRRPEPVRRLTGALSIPRILGLATQADRAHARTMALDDVRHAAAAAPGPLVVSGDNPRYFSVAGDGRVVYLAGAHFNNNFQDGIGPGRDCPDTPERFDYEAYLAFLAGSWPQFHPAVALGAVQGPPCPAPACISA